MTIRDEDLRQKRLSFYEDDMKEISVIVSTLLEKSKSKACFLVDKEGHLISKTGQSEVDAETISALVAASFAATRQIAKLLGEDEFSVLFHQGKSDSIQLNLIGERVLMVVVFDDHTTHGMVKLYAEQTAQKLSDLFDQIAQRKDDGNSGISEGFEKEADEKLDELFGE